MSGLDGAFRPAGSELAPPGARVEPAEERGLLAAPPEGWASLACLIVMVLMGALAIDQSGWAGYVRNSLVSQTSFLPIAVVLATLVGLLVARSRLNTFAAHFAGAAIGAGYLLFAVGNAVSTAPTLEGRLRGLNESVSTFVGDVFVVGIRSAETSVFLLLVGALLWAVGQLGAFSLFRRGRPGPAISLAGTALLINMSITIRDQLPQLVIFCTAALVLIVRLNLVRQVELWRARRIGDGGSAAATLFLRSGAVFVGVAIVGSLVLSTNASSAPLNRYWRGFDDTMLEVGYTLNRMLGGVSGAARGPSNLFTPTQAIRDTWESTGELVLLARTSDGSPQYWRGATYDTFDGRDWSWADRRTTFVPAGDHVLDGSAELPAGSWRRPVTAAITAENLGGDVIVAPDSPDQFDRATELHTQGAGGGFILLKMADGIEPGTEYTVSALVPLTSGENALTGARLATAGEQYPDWLTPYLEIRPEAIGGATFAVADGIVEALPADQRDPYHVAEAIQNYLYADGGFQYQTDMRGRCVGENLVDCFLRIRAGFCQQFATAMTMMLRTQGIPARYVLGYLPGQLLEDGAWQVDRSASHAWVEAYFPGYGWIRFDPTPGNRTNGQAPTRLAPGQPGGSPGPEQTVPPPGRDLHDNDFGQGGGVPTPSTQPPPTPTTIDWRTVLGLLVLLAAAGLIAFTAYRWRHLRLVEPVIAYRGVAGLAKRLGYGPRPTQTVFEFTDGLAALVPRIGPELQTVALAKVEASYSGRPVPRYLMDRLALAYRRVRLGLLRLVVRKPRLPRRPRWTARQRS